MLEDVSKTPSLWFGHLSRDAISQSIDILIKTSLLLFLRTSIPKKAPTNSTRQGFSRDFSWFRVKVTLFGARFSQKLFESLSKLQVKDGINDRVKKTVDIA